MHLEYNDDERLEYSLYILRLLLPFLKQLSDDQLLEKKMEAERQGILPPSLFCSKQNTHIRFLSALFSRFSTIIVFASMGNLMRKHFWKLFTDLM